MPRVSRRLAAVALAAAVTSGACAEIGHGPRGGPEDFAPPKLVKVTPDTGTLNTKPKEVVFRFDEVVSERPAGANGLDGLVILSPSDGVPRVSWHRKAITVRPRKGFRANTAYSITILPGMADLRGNVAKAAFTTWFSTGGEIPKTALRGVVFDWVTGRPAPNAIVQAFRRGDTTFSWLATTDSLGRFEIRAFPAGSYFVRGLIDANNNRTPDAREAFDTLNAAVADSGRVELLAFVHDSLGPRIDRLAVEDSVTLRLDFDQPYDPLHPPTIASFVLLRADSTRVPIAALLTDSGFAAQKDSAARARGDSSKVIRRPASARDTARAIQSPNVPRPPSGSAVPLPGRRPAAAAPRDTTPPPKPSRASPVARVIIRLGTPLTPAASYRLRATDIRGLSGAPRASERVFSPPRAVAPTGSDSAAARPAVKPAPNGTAAPGRPVPPATKP